MTPLTFRLTFDHSSYSIFLCKYKNLLCHAQRTFDDKSSHNKLNDNYIIFLKMYRYSREIFTIKNI